MTKAVKLQVMRVVDETPDTRTFALARPDGDDASWRYRPGQFLTVRIPSDRTGSVARCYSMSSAPDIDDELCITVKRTTAGYASNWLCDNVGAGTCLEVLPPSGQFTPTSLEGDLLLFAGGSGVTPILSIAKAVLHRGSGRVVVFYANRDDRSVIFAGALAELARRFPVRCEVVHWLESVQERPTLEVLSAFIRTRGIGQVYVCGPAPFMDLVARASEAAGLPRSAVHQEVFLSLSGDPFAEVEVGSSTSDAPPVPVEVSLEGRSLRLDWPPDITLVDLLLTKNVDVPYLCRDGECGTCQATVETGSVSMDRNDVLDPADVAAGYVLTCQARPAGDKPIRIIF